MAGFNFAHLGMTFDSSSARRGKTDLENLRGEAGKTEGAMGSLGVKGAKSMAALKVSMAAVAAAGAGIALITPTLREFDSAIARMAGISRASSKDLEAMRQTAMQLGAATEFSGKQAAEGLTFLSMAGFKARDSIAAMPAVLDLATSAAMDLGQAADVSSNIMSAFGIAAKDAADVADILAAASTKANTDVAQLGEGMKYVGPVAASLGVSMSDTAAAIGKLSDAGIQGSMAGTGLRKILSSLIAPTDKATAALQGLGLRIQDVDPRTVRFTDIVDRLAKANIGAAEAMEIFGLEGVSAVTALTSQAAGLRTLTADLENVEGAAADMAGTIRDNLDGDFLSLSSAASGLAIALGDAGVTGALRGTIQGATELVRGVTELVHVVDDAVDSVASFFDINAEAAVAVEALNVQIGNELSLSDDLSRSISDGARMTSYMAEVKLSEAEARKANVEQMIVERREAELAASGYFNVLEQISGVRDALNSMRTAGDDLEDMPARMREQYEAMEQTLVSLLGKQQEILATVNKQTGATAEEQEQIDDLRASIERIRSHLDSAVDGMVTFGTETSVSTGAADALEGILAELRPRLVEGMDGASGLRRMLALAGLSAINLGQAVSSAMAMLSRFGGAVSAVSGEGGFLGRTLSSAGGAFGSLLNSEAVSGFKNVMGDLGTTLSITYQRLQETAEGTAALDAFNKRLAGSSGSASKALSEEEKAAKKLTETIAKMELEADPVKQFTDAVKELDDARKNGLSQGAYDFHLTKATDELVSSMGEAMPLLDAFSEKAGDWLYEMWEGTPDILNDTLDMLKRFISEAAAMFLKNKLFLSVGLSGTSVSGSALSSITGTGGSSLLGSLGTGVLGSSSGFTAGTGLAGGIGATLNSTLNSGGVWGGLKSLFSVGSNAAAAGGGIAASLGALALPALAVGGIAALIKNRMKETTKVTGTSIEGSLSGAGDDLDASLYSLVSKKTTRKGIFGIGAKSSKSTSKSTISNSAIYAPMVSAQEAILDTAAVLGIGADAFEDFAYSFKINTKGLSETEIASAIEAEVEKAAEKFAGLATGLASVKREGESNIEALEALASALTGVNSVLDGIGKTAFEVSLIGAAAARHLQDAFGTLDAMTSAVSTYVEAFYSDEQKLALLTEQLEDAMAAVYVAMPQTREAYVELVEAQDLTTERGRVLYAALVSLSGSFDQLYSSADSLSEALSSAVGSGLSSINSQISLASQAAQEAAQAAETYLDLAKSLREVADEIYAGSSSSAAESSFSSILSKAMGGNIDALQGLGAAAKELVTTRQQGATSLYEAQRMAADVARQVDMAAATAETLGVASSYQEAAYNALEALLEVAKDELEAGELTTERLVAINGALSELNDQITASSAAEVRSGLDNAGNVVAGIFDANGLLMGTLSEEAARQIDSNTALFGSLENEVTGQTLSLLDASEALTGRLVQIGAGITTTAGLTARASLDAAGNVVAGVYNASGQMVAALDASTAAQIAAMGGNFSVLSLAADGQTVVLRRQVAALSGLSASTTVSAAQIVERVALVADGVNEASGLMAEVLATLNEGSSITAEQVAQGTTGVVGELATIRSILREQLEMSKAKEEAAVAAEAAAEAARLKAIDDANSELASAVQYASNLAANYNSQYNSVANQLAAAQSVAVLSDRSYYSDLGSSIRAQMTPGWGGSGAELTYAVGQKAMAQYQAEKKAAEAQVASLSAQLSKLGSVSASAVAAANASADALRQQILELGGVPAFAEGGDHLGGVRLVGERGPELEFTGPARYQSASATDRLLNGGAENVAEMRRMVAEIRRLQAIAMQQAKYVERTYDVVRDWQYRGLPAERVLS